MIKKKLEESVPVEEVKLPKFESIKNFVKSVFIILLSLLCVLIGDVIYQMNIMPTTKQIPPKTITRKESRSNLRPLISLPPVAEVNTSQSGNPKLEVTPTSVPEIQQDLSQIETTPIFSGTKETETLPLPTISEVNQEVIPLPITAKKNTVSKKTMLKDLLLLRDHLDNGISCFSDFKNLMKKENTGTELIEALMPICATPKSNFESIETVFLSEKKKALMTYYQMNNPKWLAYLKAFGTRLVDIRRLDPKKQRPKDLLSLAQTALKQKALEEALNHIQKLPPEMKADFSVFITDAIEYVHAQKTLNTYILTFEGKGE